jgi:hypothetical protein
MARRGAPVDRQATRPERVVGEASLLEPSEEIETVTGSLPWRWHDDDGNESAMRLAQGAPVAGLTVEAAGLAAVHSIFEISSYPRDLEEDRALCSGRLFVQEVIPAVRWG